MTTPNPLNDDDPEAGLSELHNVHVPRVDAVKGPATGIPFLILKSQTQPGADAPITKGTGAMDPETLDENLGDAVDAATDTSVNGDSVAADALEADNEPGSPEWEALDAAKARSVVTALTALRSLVVHLAGREDAEAFADAGDGDVCDLLDACDAIDCALGLMAKFAVDEQAEADEAADLAKSWTSFVDNRAVTKAGRVLSSANESAIQSAVDNLQNVLSQLQSAPIAAEGGEPVKVSKADGDGTADADSPIPAAIADLVAQLAVAYQTWHDSGTVAPGVADTAGDAPADDSTAAPAPEPAAPADAAPAAPVEDAAQPQPAAAPPAAAPATSAAPAADASTDDDAQTAVAKSIMEALEAKYREHISALEKRLEVVEAQPVNDGPMLAGQTPTVVARTGQETSPEGDPLADLRKELEAERNPVRKAELQGQLATAAWKLAASGNAPRI